jgi:hypothetical protein
MTTRTTSPRCPDSTTSTNPETIPKWASGPMIKCTPRRAEDRAPKRESERAQKYREKKSGPQEATLALACIRHLRASRPNIRQKRACRIQLVRMASCRVGSTPTGCAGGRKENSARIAYRWAADTLSSGEIGIRKQPPGGQAWTAKPDLIRISSKTDILAETPDDVLERMNPTVKCRNQGEMVDSQHPTKSQIRILSEIRNPFLIRK